MNPESKLHFRWPSGATLLSQVLRSFLWGMIRSYQIFISPALHGFFGPQAGCRFEPSCSTYAIQALERFPATSSVPMIVKRICRCHPWSSSEQWFDPVPECGSSKELE